MPSLRDYDPQYPDVSGGGVPYSDPVRAAADLLLDAEQVGQFTPDVAAAVHVLIDAVWVAR